MRTNLVFLSLLSYLICDDSYPGLPATKDGLPAVCLGRGGTANAAHSSVPDMDVTELDLEMPYRPLRSYLTPDFGGSSYDSSTSPCFKVGGAKKYIRYLYIIVGVSL